MPNIIKIFISLLITIFIFLLVVFFIFFSKIDISLFNFFNNNLEIKYQNSLNSISNILENDFIEKNNKLDMFIKNIDLSKFKEKAKSKNFTITDELRKFQELKLGENDLLEKIKIIDPSRNVLFSTDEKEKNITGNFIEFKSIDNIEGVIDNSKSNYFNIYILNDYVIFKKTVSIGYILFYYKNYFLNDKLKNNENIDFKNIFFANNKSIFLNKPDYIPIEKLSGLLIKDNITTISTSVTNDNKNIKIRKYRFFYKEIKNFNVSVCEIVDYNDFILDKTKKIILIFLFFFTFYLLILMVFLFRKSEFDKAKEKLSMFTTLVIEEMINAKSKNEFEEIRDSLGKRKESILKNVYFDFKKLKDNNKKNLEDQFDLVLKKVEETFQKKFESQPSFDNIDKLEKLFERLIITISEKGIPVNYQNHVKSLETKIIPSSDQKNKIEKENVEVEELEEVESVDEVEDLEEVEEAESVDSTEKVEEIEPVEELEEVGEAESVESAEKVEEVESVDELEEVGEAESIESAEKVEEVESVEELEEVGEVESAESTENKELVENLEEIPELSEVSELEDLTEIENNKGENFELENLEKSNNIEIPDTIEINEEITREDELLEDIFDKKEDVEFLKVKTSDFIDNVELNNEEIENFDEMNEIAELKDDLDDYQSASKYFPDQNENVDKEEVPKIPEEFYENNVIEDELSDKINNIEVKKNNLQILLDNIFEETKSDKISLLIKLQTKNSFMQTYQKGFKNKYFDKIELDNNNLIVKHVFTTERLAYISDMNKTKFLFQNLDFENEYEGTKSILIYPIKIFGKIRSLLILSFPDDVKKSLESIIKILENKKDVLKKNIMKLI